MDCLSCGGKAFFVWGRQGAYEILQCRGCGLVYLSSFSHINNGFYEDSGMHDGKPDVHGWLDETELDDERRAAMVSNLLVVLCGETQAQPVLNAGTLYP